VEKDAITAYQTIFYNVDEHEYDLLALTVTIHGCLTLDSIE